MLANEGTGIETETTVMFADDVLLQVTTSEKLQTLLYCATWWRGRSDATWSTEKSTNVAPEGDSDTNGVYLSGQRLKVSRAERYLRITFILSSMMSAKTQALQAEGDATARISSTMSILVDAATDWADPHYNQHASTF